MPETMIAMSYKVPPGWGPNYLVYARYSLNAASSKPVISRRHVTRHGAVGAFIQRLTELGDVPSHDYPAGQFRNLKVKDFNYRHKEIDIGVRGYAYVIIELDPDMGLVVAGTQNPVMTSTYNGDPIHGGLVFVTGKGEDATFTTGPYAPEGCRLLYFGTFGPMPVGSYNPVSIRVAKAGGKTRDGDDTIDPDVPNDGGHPVPPGRYLHTFLDHPAEF